MTGGRAVSVPVNYTMSVMIVTVMLSGLILATSDQLQSQQERTAELEIDVLTNRVAADLTAADRLARSTENTTDDEVAVRSSLPHTVAGMSYTVRINGTEIEAGEAYHVTVEIETTRHGIIEQASLKTGTPVEDAFFGGGDYVVEYVDTTGDDHPDTLEVHNA